MKPMWLLAANSSQVGRARCGRTLALLLSVLLIAFTPMPAHAERGDAAPGEHRGTSRVSDPDRVGLERGSVLEIAARAGQMGHLIAATAAGRAASTTRAERSDIARADPSDRGSTARWGWPMEGTPRISRGFDLPEQPWLPGHRGIDLAGNQGDSVLAVEAGVVTYSGVIAGTGVISLTHPDGLRSTYQPVTERITRGTRVARGDRIGTLDHGGHCVPTACLHLGAVRDRDLYVDPTPLLVPVELTLKPWKPHTRSAGESR